MKAHRLLYRSTLGSKVIKKTNSFPCREPQVAGHLTAGVWQTRAVRCLEVACSASACNRATRSAPSIQSRAFSSTTRVLFLSPIDCPTRVPRRARISDSQTFESLNSRLESYKEDEEFPLQRATGGLPPDGWSMANTSRALPRS